MTIAKSKWLWVVCCAASACSDPASVGGTRAPAASASASASAATTAAPAPTLDVAPGPATPDPTPTISEIPGGSAPPAATAPPMPSPRPSETPPELLPPLFAEPVRNAARALPISGGTLLVTADGTTAVAADPDRDRVFLVDLAARSVRAVATEAGDEPGRVAEGEPGSVYVAARHAGVVLVVDRASASVTARIPVCNAPRGLAYAAASATLYVACRSGALIAVDTKTQQISRQLRLDDDLRDVIVDGDRLLVTRFRSAEVLAIDAAGTLLHRYALPDLGGFRAGVAFRAVPHPGGTLLLSHQIESEAPIGTGAGSYYGGGCFGGGVVQQALSTLTRDGSALPPPVTTASPQSIAPPPAPADPPIPADPGDFAPPAVAPANSISLTLPGLVGPTDLALSRDGRRIAIVASGNAWPIAQEAPTLFIATLTDPSGRPPAALSTSACGGSASQARYAAGEPVAVAFDAAGRYVIQSREPALLELEGDIFISLSDESRFDTGLAMFQANAGSGIACASCHPEGGEDGHVWSFANLGLRRSQSLSGGVASRAPFHWSGDLANFDTLFDEVMLKRMALPVVPPRAHVDALAAFLDRIPAETAPDALDAAAVERGRVLFADAKIGCASCHSGPDYADNRVHDVGTGGAFVTPSLRSVAARAPYMHDGCAVTLRERFGACGGTSHGDTSALDEPALSDLVTFMQSL